MNPTYWGDYAARSGELYGIDSSVGGNLFALSNISTPNTGTRRHVSYIQPNRAGSRVAFVSLTASTSFQTYGQTNPSTEQLRIVSNVAVSASGALSGTPSVAVLEGATSGRVSSSVALDFSDRRVYYGYSTTGNENGMVLREKTLDATGAVLAGTAGTRSFNGFAGTSNRFSVLWSGR